MSKGIYKSVLELDRLQLDYLKVAMFYGDDDHAPLYLHFISYQDIPDEMVYNRFAHISFVDEDFGTNN